MRTLLTAALPLALLLSAPLGAEEIKNPLQESATWTDLAYDVLGDAQPQIGETAITLDAPYRAHDAAIVPVRVTQVEGAANVDSLIMVVDENPAPVVAEFNFGKAMMPLNFETRVRVNQYSNIRAIASSQDGMHMTGRFVKASGGCSAPATKDAAVALATMGQMKLKHFDDAPAMSNARREAQIMLRHPNYSGLQRDQITQLFINAHFIDELEVYQGDDLLFSLTGGISISENPVFRFDYTDNGSQTLRVRAHDTEGNVFEEEFSKIIAS